MNIEVPDGTVVYKSGFDRFVESATGVVVQRLWIGHISGQENVPAKGPFVVIVNHASYMDFLIIATVFHRILKRPVHFWAKQKVTNHPIFSYYARKFQAIALDLDKPLRESWQESVSRLQAGHNIAIFPEGTRSRTGKLLPFRLGYLHLANACQVPILPVYLSNTHRILPPYGLVPRLVKADVTIHSPVLPTARTKAQLREVNADIFSNIYLPHAANYRI